MKQFESIDNKTPKENIEKAKEVTQDLENLFKAEGIQGARIQVDPDSGIAILEFKNGSTMVLGVFDEDRGIPAGRNFSIRVPQKKAAA